MGLGQCCRLWLMCSVTCVVGLPTVLDRATHSDVIAQARTSLIFILMHIGSLRTHGHVLAVLIQHLASPFPCAFNCQCFSYHFRCLLHARSENKDHMGRDYEAQGNWDNRRARGAVLVRKGNKGHRGTMELRCGNHGERQTPSSALYTYVMC